MTTKNPELSNPVHRFVYRATGAFNVLNCSNRQMLREALRSIGKDSRTRQLRSERHRTLRSLINRLEFERQLVSHPQLTPGRLLTLSNKYTDTAANDSLATPKTPTHPPPYDHPVKLVSDILTADETVDMKIWPNLVDANFDPFTDLPEMVRSFSQVMWEPLQGVIVTDSVWEQVETMILARDDMVFNDPEPVLGKYEKKFNNPTFKYRTQMGRELTIQAMIHGVRLYTASKPH